MGCLSGGGGLVEIQIHRDQRIAWSDIHRQHTPYVTHLGLRKYDAADGTRRLRANAFTYQQAARFPAQQSRHPGEHHADK